MIISFNRLGIVGAVLLALGGHASAGEVCTTTPAPGTPPTAPGTNALACGAESQATGGNSTAVGTQSCATDFATTAVGHRAAATGFGATAIGVESQATGIDSTSIGFAVAGGTGATAIGTVFNGVRTRADGEASSAFGSGAVATGRTSLALGAGSQASGADAVALGSNSVADRANTISVGSSTQQRQIVNVAAGTQATDAVNVQQLQDTLNSARAYTDTAVATGGTNAAAYTDAREAIIRSETAQADAQIRSEVQAGDAQTLSAANAYTDARFSQIVGGSFDALDARMDRFEDRLQVQDERISRLGALTTAMAQMGANASAATAGRGRLSVGAGWYDGEKALSVGYGRRVGTRASVTLGAAFSGDEHSAGVGFGLDL